LKKCKQNIARKNWGRNQINFVEVLKYRRQFRKFLSKRTKEELKVR
jgi:hypothetical protein